MRSNTQTSSYNSNDGNNIRENHDRIDVTINKLLKFKKHIHARNNSKCCPPSHRITLSFLCVTYTDNGYYKKKQAEIYRITKTDLKYCISHVQKHKNDKLLKQ